MSGARAFPLGRAWESFLSPFITDFRAELVFVIVTSLKLLDLLRPSLCDVMPFLFYRAKGTGRRNAQGSSTSNQEWGVMPDALALHLKLQLAAARCTSWTHWTSEFSRT